MVIRIQWHLFVAFFGAIGLAVALALIGGEVALMGTGIMIGVGVAWIATILAIWQDRRARSSAEETA